MNKSRTTTLILTALAGVAIGGCEMAPGTYTAMGTTPSAGDSGLPTGAQETPYRAQPVTTNPGTPEASPFDPLAPSTTGVTMTNTNGPGLSQSSNPALSLYGETLARSMTPRVTSTTSKVGGTNMTQVSFAMEGADFDPDISPDGKKIVYASTQHKFTSDIYIKNVDSKVVSQLTNDPANDVMPKISPDGTRLSFASNRTGNWDIFVMPITGGRAIQLTNTAADDLHPTWSPDGTKLAFCRLGEVSRQWEIWITDVANSGVASFVCYGLFPTWCPMPRTGANGADKIAFQRSRERGDRAFGIWTIDFRDGQAGNLTEVVSDPIAACINPAWSLDGQWLAFATVPNPQQWAHTADTRPPTADLWLIDINGSSRISLAAGSAVNLMPAWGPNNRLFFVSDRAGVDNVWSMDTNQVIQLAAMNMKASTPYVAKPMAAERPPLEIQSPGSRVTTQPEPQAPGEGPRQH